MLDRLTAIGEMTLAMSRASTVEQICHEALRAVVRVLEAPRASVRLFDPDGRLRFKAWEGLSDVYRRAVEGYAPWTPGQPGALPVVVPDVAHEPGLAGYREIMLAEGIGAMASVPLVTGGGPIGVVGMYYDAPRTFDPDLVQLARTVAVHTAFAIDRQRLVEQLEAERGLFVGGPTVVFKWRHQPGWPAEYASPNVYTVFGWRPEALTSGEVSYASLLHPDDFARVEAEENALMASNRTHYEHEYRLRRADGTYCWVSDFTVPLRGPDGTLTHTRGYVVDITERKAAAERLLQAEGRLRETQRLESLGVLAGGIAHDFNNLLMGILGNAALALGEVPPESPLVDQIREIEAAARRAADLTRQLLAYSGKGKFVVERVDLSRLVEETVRVLLQTMSPGISVRWELDRTAAFVDGDATQLRQVVSNLFTNACDAHGSARGSITLRTARLELAEPDPDPLVTGKPLGPGTFCLFEVADDGPGMDEATARQIFDPFFTTKFAGRGLGLPAVQGIVRGHRGGIRVSTTPGQGTTVRVLLPAATQPAERVQGSGAAGGPGAQRTVLVVDDEAMVRNVTRRTLERAGFRVLVAESGRTALDLLKTEHADVGLVLLDLTMPELNGEETLALMHDCWPGLRVLLSSGYSDEVAEDGRTRKGQVGFLQKPYLPADLVRAVQQAFDP
ncbi:MAG TPA: ATP-binding protein [Gemmatimonadales bacterium]|nr:ATP-binding protein [Gemmatimonadales bacterium]